MLEVLVIYMCVKDFACKEMSTQYYKTNFEMQQAVKKQKKKLENYMGKEVAVTMGVFILGIADQKIRARVTRNFNITYEDSSIRGDLRWEF